MTTNFQYFKFSTHGLSDIGFHRKTNQDAWGTCLGGSFVFLADGIGGRQSGDVASQYVVDQCCSLSDDFLNHLDANEASISQIQQCLLKLLNTINKGLFSKSHSHPSFHGMGSTLCCIYFYKNFAIGAHLGDSRIYLLREGSLKQITQDHVQDVLRENDSTSQVYRCLTKAMGIKAIIDPSVFVIEIQDNDRFLMCSDGLSGVLEFDEIQALISHKHPVFSIEQMLLAAKKSGSRDNITIIVTDIHKIMERECTYI